MREHPAFWQDASHVAAAPSKAERDRRSQEHGIKSSSSYPDCLLSTPLSIPTDFMHLVFKDVLTTLVNLLGGTSSNLEKEHFVVAEEKWEEIGRATANSGNTIPSCFTARFPISLSSDRDVRLTIGRSGSNILPVPSMYYKHIMRFSELERECLEFEYRRDRLPGLKRDWARWVEDYERGAAPLFIINCLLSFAANNPSRKIVLQG